MSNQAKSFWFVWCPTANPPRYRHETYWSAENEAKRLAREHPGSRFVVLESKVAFEVTDIHRTDFAIDADIPF